MATTKGRDGTTIAYRVIGDGPLSVVLVHGWMTSGAVYDAFLEALDTTGFRVIVPDLRGTGESERPATGHTIETYAAEVLAVADAAGASSFVIVGHSMGGQIAAYLAATAPERVRGAALLCPVPPSGIALPPDAAGLFRGSAGNRGAQETILKLACKEITDGAREALLDVAGQVSAAAIEQAFDAWTAGGFADRMGRVTSPLLVVATDDPFLPPPFLKQEIVARVPHARLVYLPGPGHYVQVERPRETAAIVGAFLAGLKS
jgi:pimeloyl-ACP methyl ester carboxylesterase